MKNFDKNKIFTGTELKQIVGEIVKGRERISQTMDEIGIPYTSPDVKRKYYRAFDDDKYNDR